jgi:nitrite reductase/ring-hydroxylating ferredoxin subunit
MQNDFRPVLKVAEIAPGGMKAVEVDGHEIVICNCDGQFYALARRCGHMNASLEKGTLDGTILTCAMHCAQFDVTTGEALSGPVPRDAGDEPLPPKLGTYLQNLAALMQSVRTESIRTFPTKVDMDQIWVSMH